MAVSHENPTGHCPAENRILTVLRTRPVAAFVGPFAQALAASGSSLHKSVTGLVRPLGFDACPSPGAGYPSGRGSNTPVAMGCLTIRLADPIEHHASGGARGVAAMLDPGQYGFSDTDGCCHDLARDRILPGAGGTDDFEVRSV